MTNDDQRQRNRLLFAVRYLLPAAIVLAGVIALIVSPHSDTLDGAFGLIGAGIAVALLNVFYRIGSSGERERDAEVAARAYFDLHGEWPEEEERPRGRKWRLPEGVATPESEESERR